MRRLRMSGKPLFGSTSLPWLKNKTLNSWSAIQDTYFSTKDIFERHRVVFTISTSLASVATAWAGYSLRHLHEAQVEKRLDSIEKAMNNSRHMVRREEIKKIVDSSSPNKATAACAATAGTALVLGYCLGWRGGRWYSNRRYRKEQMRLLGQAKPNIKWKLGFPRRPNRSPQIP